MKLDFSKTNFKELIIRAGAWELLESGEKGIYLKDENIIELTWGRTVMRIPTKLIDSASMENRTLTLTLSEGIWSDVAVMVFDVLFDTQA